MYDECKECAATPAGSLRCNVALKGRGTKSRCPLDNERKKKAEEKLFPVQDSLHPAIAQPPKITADEFAKRNGETKDGRTIAEFLAKHPHYPD